LVQENLRRRQDGEAPSMRYTFRGRRKDGSLAYFEVFGSCVDFDGRFAVMSTVLDVTERKLSEQELQRIAAELRTAYRRLAQAQEAERRAITKELHDQVGQNLSALNLNLHYIDRELSDAERARLKGRLDDSLVLLEETVVRVRSVMGNLRPPMLDDFGLFATLRWLAHEVTHRSGIECELRGTAPDERLPAEIESTLVRIAQEALMNAVKYSKARRITLALAVTERQVRLEIADDGVGFDLGRQERSDVNPTWGLMTMRERAAALGGLVHVASAPGEGTRVVAEIPWKPA
jgi:two-component system sensor histidine kinase UhpB